MDHVRVALARQPSAHIHVVGQDHYCQPAEEQNGVKEVNMGLLPQRRYTWMMRMRMRSMRPLVRRTYVNEEPLNQVSKQTAERTSDSHSFRVRSIGSISSCCHLPKIGSSGIGMATAHPKRPAAPSEQVESLASLLLSAEREMNACPGAERVGRAKQSAPRRNRERFGYDPCECAPASALCSMSGSILGYGFMLIWRLSDATCLHAYRHEPHRTLNTPVRNYAVK